MTNNTLERPKVTTTKTYIFEYSTWDNGKRVIERKAKSEPEAWAKINNHVIQRAFRNGDLSTLKLKAVSH